MIIKLFNFFKIKRAYKEEDLHFSSQQMSYALASLLLIFFFIFMAGYYWGKKSAIESFAAQLESDSLSDKISYAFCSNYDYKGDQTQSDDESEDENNSEYNLEKSKKTQDNSHNNQSQTVSEVVKVVEDNCFDESAVNKNINQVNIKHFDNKQYIAELAGFGSITTAKTYEKALAKNGHAVKIITRKSRTSKGREIKWYQVITQTYNNQNELLEEIKKIKKVAPIKDVKVVIIDQQRDH